MTTPTFTQKLIFLLDLQKQIIDEIDNRLNQIDEDTEPRNDDNDYNPY